MGIKLQQYKNGDYRIWSSTSDSWLTKRMAEQDTIEFLAKSIQERADREIRELRATFPAQYWDINDNRIWNDKLKKKYAEFYEKELNRCNVNTIPKGCVVFVLTLKTVQSAVKIVFDWLFVIAFVFIGKSMLERLQRRWKDEENERHDTGRTNGCTRSKRGLE